MKQKGKAKKASKNKAESLKDSTKQNRFGSVRKVSSSSLSLDRLIMAMPVSSTL